MKHQLRPGLETATTPLNIRTSFLIILAVAGAAVNGVLELFVLHTGSKDSDALLKGVGVVIFFVAGYIATHRVRGLQEQVRKELTSRDRALEQLRSAEDYNRVLIENSQGLMCVHDLNGILLSVNRSASDGLGYSQKELIRRNMRDLVPESLRSDIDVYLARIRAKGKDSGCLIVRAKRGDLRTWSYKNAIFTRRNGERLIVGWAQDVTEKAQSDAAHEKARHALGAANARLQEQASRLTAYNQQLALLHKITHAMQAGKTLAEATRLGLAPLQELFVDCGIGIYLKDPTTGTFRKVGESGHLMMKPELTPGECSSLREGVIKSIDPNCSSCLYSNRRRRFQGKAYTIPLVDEQETIGLLVIEDHASKMPDVEILQNASDHLKAMLKARILEQKLTEQSTRDELTGLLNRRFMEESLRASVARAKRTGDPLSVVMLDIDHFKRLNDTFGHQAGDEVLRLVGKLIQRSVRSEDVACRYGGEEFALIMPGATVEIAASRAESLRRSIAQLDLNHVAIGLKEVTISAGVAGYSTRMNESTLVGAADEFLYKAKMNGRNRVERRVESSLLLQEQKRSVAQVN